jgi:hypothetical protein
MLLFRNSRTANGQVRFERAGAAPKSGLAIAQSARGLALADFDGDGRVDAITNNMDSSPTILRNVTDTKNHWLALRLIGDVSGKSPKDAIGSKLFVTTGKLRQRFDLTSGGNYASQSEQIIYVGLGETLRIDKLEIIWPNGEQEIVPVENIDRRLVIQQGATRTKK